MKTESYTIHNSQNGQVIGKFNLEPNQVENASSDNAEGHFSPSAVDGLEKLVECGIRSVYAILN